MITATSFLNFLLTSYLCYICSSCVCWKTFSTHWVNNCTNPHSWHSNCGSLFIPLCLSPRLKLSSLFKPRPHSILCACWWFVIISFCLSLGMSVHKGKHHHWNGAQVTDSARQECQWGGSADQGLAQRKWKPTGLLPVPSDQGSLQLRHWVKVGGTRALHFLPLAYDAQLNFEMQGKSRGVKYAVYLFVVIVGQTAEKQNFLHISWPI